MVKLERCKNYNEFRQNTLNIHQTFVFHDYEARIKFRDVNKWKAVADARNRFSYRYIKALTRSVVGNRRAPSIMHYSNKDRTQHCLVSCSSSMLHQAVGRLLKTAEFRVVFLFASQRLHGPRCRSRKIPSSKPWIEAKVCSNVRHLHPLARNVSAVEPRAQGFCVEICGR